MPANASGYEGVATQKWFYGYNLTIYLSEHSGSGNFWRGVDHCEAYALLSDEESRCKEQTFNENIRVCVGDWEEFALDAGCPSTCTMHSDCQVCAKQPPHDKEYADLWNSYYGAKDMIESDRINDFSSWGWNGAMYRRVCNGKRFVCPRTAGNSCSEKEEVENGRRVQPGWAACHSASSVGNLVAVGIFVGALLTPCAAFYAFRWARHRQYYKAKNRLFKLKKSKSSHVLSAG